MNGISYLCLGLTLLFLGSLCGSGLLLAEEGDLGEKLWQELNEAKLPEPLKEKVIKEELGPSDLAFLEDQLPSPKKDQEEQTFNNQNIADTNMTSDSVSLGQAAPVRKNEIKRRSEKIREEKDGLFRRRSRPDSQENEIPQDLPTLRKRSR